jgi:ParB-like chromosome segregation protein Spo0J
MKSSPALDQVALSLFSGQDKFRLSFSRPHDRLVESIRAVGQATPLICRKTRQGPELVSGYLRCEAMRVTGKKKALALVFPASALSETGAMRLAFFENALTRGLNLIEQAMAVDKLKKLGVGAQSIARDYFQKARLPASVAVIEALDRLNRLEPGWKIFLVEKQIGLRHASWFCRLKAPERKALEFIIDLKATASQFREILEMADSISKREQKSVSELFQTPGLADTLADEKSSSPVKLDRLLKSLKQLQYPGYHKLCSRNRKLMGEMKIPAEVRIEPHDFFEGPEYKMELLINHATPASEIFEKILAAANSSAWEKMFNLDDED